MGIKVSEFYWDIETSGKRSERLMLLALAEWADNIDGTCCPSIPSIAKRCALSDRGAQKVIDRLCANGQLAIEENMGMRTGSGSRTNRFHLLAYQASIEAIRVNTPTDKGEPIRSPIDNAKGELFEQRVNFLTDKGEPIRSPDPSLDPSLDPSDDEIACAKPPPSSSSSSTKPPAPVDQTPTHGGSETVSPPPPPDPPPPAPTAANEAYTQAKRVYENNFGTLTTIMQKRITEALRMYPAEWVMMAMEKAVTAGKRRWDYVEGILRNWESEGFNGRAQRATATTIVGTIGHRKDSPKSRSYGEWTEADEQNAAILAGF